MPERFDSNGLRRALAMTLVFTLTACGGNTVPARDASEVELLRVRIAKARHAIEETRNAIARSAGSPIEPELYARLGELLSEEARYHYRLSAARSPEARPEALHVPQVRLLKARAIGTFNLILERFPEADLVDRVLFNLAFEHRELNEPDEMRNVLERLLRDFPNSSYRAQAAIVLADHYQENDDSTRARRVYESITAGDAISRVAALAHYRLAWIHVNSDDCNRALRSFTSAIETNQAALAQIARVEAGEEDEVAGNDTSALPVGEAVDVSRSAITDMVYCYTTERRPGRALEDFRELAADRPTFVAALRKLARRYSLMDNADAALPILRELLSLADASRDRIDDTRQLHTALRRAEDWDEIGRDIELMLNPLDRYRGRLGVTVESRQRMLAEFEVYARDLLTRAQGALEDVRERDKPARAASVARGYARYLETFNEIEAASEMLLNYADVLATSGRPFDAGQVLLEAAARLEGDSARDALYDAVGRFQAALSTRDDEDSWGDRDILPAALRSAAAQVLRFELSEEQQRQVRFALAQSYYDEGDHRAAIDHLTALAYEFPNTNEARAAARLVLDSYNTLDDPFGLLSAGRRFLADNTPVPSMRAEIEPLVAAAEQRTIDSVSLEAAGDDGGDMSRLVDLAEQHRGTELGERALMNAFLAARAAGDTTQMYELGETIAQQYPNSEQLSGMLSTLGQTAVGRFEIERALTFLQRAAESGHESSGVLRVAAGRLLEGVGRDSEAATAYRAAMNGEGGNNEAADALAKLLERQGDAAGLLSTFGMAEGRSSDVQARVALALVQNGQTAEAEGLFQNVIALGGSVGALARAHYGMGELLSKALDQFPALNDPMVIEEFLAVVELAQASYIESVRQGEGVYGAAALGRLATLAERGATMLAGADVSGVDASVREAVRQGIQGRVQFLRQTATEAMRACTSRAWEGHFFTPVIRECLAGRRPSRVIPEFDSLEPHRASGSAGGDLDELRQRVAQNPEDLESLRELAAALLAAGDGHAARLILLAVAEHGGTPEDLNALGEAHASVGDHSEALRAFARSAAGGHAPAIENLKAKLRELGLGSAAGEVDQHFGAGAGEGGEAGATASAGGGNEG